MINFEFNNCLDVLNTEKLP